MMTDVSLKPRLTKLGFALFFSYMSVALALPVVSIFVTGEFKLSNWMGGLAVGISFVSTILSRKYAGYVADTKSSKSCTMAGLLLYVLAAAVCAVSAVTGLPVWMAFSVLIAGRLVLGLGESLTLVGLTNWHVTLLGPQHSGKIIAVVGMAMYGAFAVGGPVGLGLYNRFGFSAVMLASFALPVIGLLMFHSSPDVRPHRTSTARVMFIRILGSIWKQGAVVGLQGVGFAVLGAFISLYFRNQNWPHAGLGLTFFGSGFVLCRILFGALPDRIGGVKVAAVSIMVETLGQGMLWLAPGYHQALAGALLTGLGCSMIFPAMGVEVITQVAPELRATAFGGFAAFQDVAYAFSAPIAGVLADRAGYPAVFMFGCLAAALGIVMVLSMGRKGA